MPYDPSLPLPNSPLESQVIRDQLQALFVLINNIITVAAAQVDSVNTINHNEPATATVNLVGNTLHFSFDIPRGGVGAPGPPFAQALVDAVNTLDAGQPATVTVNFDGTFVRFTFGIPRGPDGGQGIQGEQGIQGTPGEVTNSALANAISGTSNNTNGVMTLDTPFADPDAETLRQAYNTLVLAARR